MLVLTRKEGESIVLSVDGQKMCTVKVVGYDGKRDRVRIGIEAPKVVDIHRAELLDRE